MLVVLLLVSPTRAQPQLRTAEDPGTIISLCGASTARTNLMNYVESDLGGRGLLHIEDFTLAPPARPDCYTTQTIYGTLRLPLKDRYGLEDWGSFLGPTINFTPDSHPRLLTKAQADILRGFGLQGHFFICEYTLSGGILTQGGSYAYMEVPANCFDTCSDCQNSAENACFSCKAPFALDWTNETDEKKKGRCLCQKGAINAANTGCDLTVCHETCSSCQEAGADKCYSCAHYSFTQGTRAADGTLASCSNDYTGPCDPSCGTCFGPNANQCLTCSTEGATPDPTAETCPSVSNCHETCETCSADKAQDKCLTCKNLGAAGTLTLLNGECRCQSGTYFVSGEARCAACHSDC